MLTTEKGSKTIKYIAHVYLKHCWPSMNTYRLLFTSANNTDCVVSKVSGEPKNVPHTHTCRNQPYILKPYGDVCKSECVILFHAYIKWSWTVCPDLIMFNNLRSFTHVSFFFSSFCWYLLRLPLLPLLVSVCKHAFISFTVAHMHVCMYASRQTQSILRKRSISTEFQSFCVFVRKNPQYVLYPSVLVAFAITSLCFN